MFYLNLFVKPKMPCFFIRTLKVCGSHVDQSNKVQHKSQCRTLLGKDLPLRYDLNWYLRESCKSVITSVLYVSFKLSEEMLTAFQNQCRSFHHLFQERILTRCLLDKGQLWAKQILKFMSGSRRSLERKVELHECSRRRSIPVYNVLWFVIS